VAEIKEHLHTITDKEIVGIGHQKLAETVM
jgi:hypothetical protein